MVGLEGHIQNWDVPHRPISKRQRVGASASPSPNSSPDHRRGSGGGAFGGSDSGSNSDSGSGSDSDCDCDGDANMVDDAPPAHTMRWPMPTSSLPPPSVTVTGPDPQATVAKLAPADEILVRCCKGKSRSHKSALVADFNQVAALAEAEGQSRERARVDAVLAEMEATGSISPALLRRRLLGEPPAPVEHSTVISPSMKALDKELEKAGVRAPAFKNVTVEACGHTATLYVRDILECYSLLIGAECCQVGETFLMASPELDPDNPVIAEQADGANFREAEAEARRTHPDHCFCGGNIWVDATPVTNSMGTSVYPVWVWVANVVGSHRHKAGHAIVVGFLDTLKDVKVRQPGSSALAAADVTQMVKTDLWDEMMWIIKRPLMEVGADTDRLGKPYPGHDPEDSTTDSDFDPRHGHAARGGVLPRQRLPGLQERHAPFLVRLIQVVCDVSC